MKSRNSEIAVGVFVIVFAVALFFLAMKVSGLVGTTLKDGYEMTATFDNVNGIKPRAKVAMSGVKVGQVDSITLDPITRLATVKIVLDGTLTSFNAQQLKQVQESALEELRYSADFEAAKPVQQKDMEQQLISNMKSITNIDEDAYIMVATNGLLGEKYLKIVPGGGANFLKRGAQISNTQSTMEIEDLISKFVTGGAGDTASKQDTGADNLSAPEETTNAQTSFVE